MIPIEYLNYYVLPAFKELLKVENKELILIKNGEYQELFKMDKFDNTFKLNLKDMIKSGGLGKFEINNIHYKCISNWVLRQVNNHSESSKFYSELITLSSYLTKYNIKPVNLKKLSKSPDFLIEDQEKNIYLIEIFFSKDKLDWEKHSVSMNWSISNSIEDLNELGILCETNYSINKNLEVIQHSLDNLSLKKVRLLDQSGDWIFTTEETLISFVKHMKKLNIYRNNNKVLNNLTFLIDMGVDKCIEYSDMLNFSKVILLNVKENNYNFHNFKIRIILINQIDTYSFDIN